jgi:DNA-3-methyladenine glycosylase II
MSIVNSKDVKQLIEADEMFGFIHDLYGIPPNWSRPEGFISICKIILEQQVSLASAQAHFNQLNHYLPAFTPANILKLDDQEMRKCQISRQKTIYLRELSIAVQDKKIELEKLSKHSEEEIRKQLISIKGIGDWTTDIYLMFCLQKKDIFPIGDIAIINTVKELRRVKTREGIARLSKKWKPFRSLASYFLWHYYLQKRGKKGV